MTGDNGQLTRTKRVCRNQKGPDYLPRISRTRLDGLHFQPTLGIYEIILIVHENLLIIYRRLAPEAVVFAAKSKARYMGLDDECCIACEMQVSGA